MSSSERMNRKYIFLWLEFQALNSHIRSASQVCSSSACADNGHSIKQRTESQLWAEHLHTKPSSHGTHFPRFVYTQVISHCFAGEEAKKEVLLFLEYSIIQKPAQEEEVQEWLSEIPCGCFTDTCHQMTHFCFFWKISGFSRWRIKSRFPHEPLKQTLLSATLWPISGQNQNYKCDPHY